ncbi:MAG: hypothetical protein NT001_05920 [Candidatus Woesearchaeota archaeon]|nr:hypothetical protein [Candidatus Woesearchaeota archaeon]
MHKDTMLRNKGKNTHYYHTKHDPKSNSIFIRSRKAVSPLIATVLLIAFAVALGAVVMNWGRSYVEDTQAFAKEKSSTEIKCSMDIRTEILRIGERAQICYTQDPDDENKGVINFTIQNSGTGRIDGLRVQAIGNASIVSLEINDTFNPAEPKREYMNYSQKNNGSIMQVRFTPLITVEDKGVWCAQSALKIEGVDSC